MLNADNELYSLGNILDFILCVFSGPVGLREALGKKSLYNGNRTIRGAVFFFFLLMSANRFDRIFSFPSPSDDRRRNRTTRSRTAWRTQTRATATGTRRSAKGPW